MLDFGDSVTLPLFGTLVVIDAAEYDLPHGEYIGVNSDYPNGVNFTIDDVL